MDIFDMVNEKSCSTSLTAEDKEDCLRKLADLAAKSITDVSRETILNSLIERENMVSTGLEDGIAIPHARVKGMNDFIIGIAVFIPVPWLVPLPEKHFFVSIAVGFYLIVIRMLT